MSPREAFKACHTYCPTTQTYLFTRAPFADLSTAVDVGNQLYTRMPHAFEFERLSVPGCGCHMEY